MAKKTEAEKLVTVKAAVPVVIWRANRPLNDEQYDNLQKKLKAAEKQTGVEIMLVPFSVDVEIAADLQDQEVNPKEESAAGADEE